MTRLYCATGNPGKLREFLLAANHAPVDIELVPNFRALPPAVEDGSTFAENAVKKALHYAPGVYSARYAGPHATDESNNRLLLENLRGIRNRPARFVCAIALVEGGEVRGVYRGAVEGSILDAPRGAHGFGYDPLFYYEPFACTFGEADDGRKFLVSHRGQALRAMLAALAL